MNRRLSRCREPPRAPALYDAIWAADDGMAAIEDFFETEPEDSPMTHALIPHQDLNLSQIARALASSGYFQDAREAAQAVVKVMAGAELGIPPVAAMSGIHIVKGKPQISSTTMAALVKRSGRYNFRVRELNDKKAIIEFFEGDESAGISEFSIEDARRAGTQNIDKYPRNMLYARAMSNGVKWFCPDLFSGPVYTPEDFDQPAPPEPPAPTEAVVSNAAPEAPVRPLETAADGTVVDTETGEIVEEVPTQAAEAAPEAPAYRVEMLNEIAALEKTVCGNPKHIENARLKYLEVADLAAATDEALSTYLDRLSAKAEEKKAA